MAGRLLIADPSRDSRRAVRETLQGECFDVQEVADGEAALAVATREPLDLVLLELDLPKVSGTEVLRTLRAASAVPIIVLSARDSEIDRVLGLELGADDYVSKPFSRAELVSRVRALLRRRELDRVAVNGVVREIGGIRIDLGLHEVSVDGRTVYLTGSQFKLLALLAEQTERVVSRREIARRLWASDHVGDHVCDVHISNLRHKIERNPSEPERIVTVRGRGYRLVAA